MAVVQPDRIFAVFLFDMDSALLSPHPRVRSDGARGTKNEG